MFQRPMLGAIAMAMAEATTRGIMKERTTGKITIERIIGTITVTSQRPDVSRLLLPEERLLRVQPVLNSNNFSRSSLRNSRLRSSTPEHSSKPSEGSTTTSWARVREALWRLASTFAPRFRQGFSAPVSEDAPEGAPAESEAINARCLKRFPPFT